MSLPQARPAVVQAVVLAVGLAGCVALVFLTVQDTSALLLHRPPGAGSWLVATGLVALLVPFVRPWIERVADRAAFGRDGDPYAVMSRFVAQVTDAIAVDEVLPHLARTATTALHAPRGEARLLLEDGSEWRQTWPPDTREVSGDVSLALQHDGQDVGRLGVEVRSDHLSPADRAILDRLAGPAGLALANVRLTYELRRQLAEEMALADRLWTSRRRLLDAAAEQQARFGAAVTHRVRRRLDEATQLVAQGAQRAQRAEGAQGAQGDDGALDGARTAVQEALDALRELAVGVFPPVLAERGLAAALDMHLADHQPGVVLTVDAGPERCAPEIETAAYFCAVALVEDADASARATVRLAMADGLLTVTVMSTCPVPAQTLLLVRDRAEAVAGTVEADSSDAGLLAMVRLPLASATVPS